MIVNRGHVLPHAERGIEKLQGLLRLAALIAAQPEELQRIEVGRILRKHRTIE